MTYEQYKWGIAFIQRTARSSADAVRRVEALKDEYYGGLYDSCQDSLRTNNDVDNSKRCIIVSTSGILVKKCITVTPHINFSNPISDDECKIYE